MSRTEAERILQSGATLSINAHGWLTTLCKDICSLIHSKQDYVLESVRQSLEGLFQVLQWRLDNTITPVEVSQIYAEWLRSNGHEGAPALG